MTRRPYGVVFVGIVYIGLISLVACARNLERQSFLPVVIREDFATIMQRDKAAESEVMQRQTAHLGERYDLSDRPAARVMMSGGRKPVQEGVRVTLLWQVSWDQLAAMSPAEIRDRDLLPPGFPPLPHVKHEVGGQVFPKFHIDELQRQEGRSLKRFDVDFDLPDHLVPEFPPPIFLSTRPELGDVAQGQLLTIKNYYPPKTECPWQAQA